MEEQAQGHIQNGMQANLIHNHALHTYRIVIEGVSVLWNTGLQSVTHEIIFPFLFLKEIFPLCKWFQCSYIINLLKIHRPHCLLGPLNLLIRD